METEVENWLQKYDVDMGEKQVETLTRCTLHDAVS